MRRAPTLSTTCALASVLVLGPLAAAAQEAPIVPAPATLDAGAELRELGRTVEITKRVFGSVEFGRGFRFNNPYRLATELGSSPQSVSVTAPYADVALGFGIGPADGLQLGASVHGSFAMAGVPQAVLTPTFQLSYRGPHPFLTYGRIGPSVILTPDPTIGAELAGGFAWFLTGRLAVASEIVFDLDYGAGTHHVAVATYPILSGQLGLLFDWEFLP